MQRYREIFKEFIISEAKVSPRNLEKAVSIFLKILNRGLKTKFYRFGGDDGIVEIKNGIGILFFYDKKKVIRFNYVNGEITSITLWKYFKLGATGDFTIDLNGLGLLQSGKKLIDIIQNPSAGIVPTMQGLYEARVLIKEAKRISPRDFALLVSDKMSPGERIDRLKWETITDIAANADVQVPTTVRKDAKVPGTKGQNTLFDLTQYLDSSDKSNTQVSKENEPIYYVKITSQDPNTKKFLSVKGDKRAESMLKTMADAVQNPKMDQVKQEMTDPNTLFGHMSNLVQIVARKSRNALLIYGGPGTGKTFVVTQTLKKEGLTKGNGWHLIKGKISTSALYQMLFMHRKGDILLFDDTDSLWKDQEAANLLKAALDSYDERIISWVSPRTINVSLLTDQQKEDINSELDIKLKSEPEASHKLPSEFEYNGRIIFISNLTYDKFDPAVMTRSAKIDMTLTREQMFTRMESILRDLGDSSVPFSTKQEILGFIKEQSSIGALSEVSMRTYVAAEDLYKSGLPNWKELLDYV
jgi:hypothetical protein